MASEQRLSVIRDVLEGFANSSPKEKVLIWESRILPLFRILLHPSVVDSVVLEQETATLFRSLLGIDATRLHRLYRSIFGLVDCWSELHSEDNDSGSGMEALALACGVLSKVVNTSTANTVNAHFTSIVDEIQLRLEVFGNRKADFHTIQADKYLEYVSRRLGIGQSLPNAAQASSVSSGNLAEFTLSQDMPGRLSKRGPRHDNDHVDIFSIKLLPTHEEIMSSRDEYLPTANPAQHHLQGLQGLLDRHFRLLREDTLNDLRHAIRVSVESSVELKEVHTRVVQYERAFAVDVSFKWWSGLEFIVRIDQPRAAKCLDKMGRAAWWNQEKRLMDGSLVCIVDQAGTVFFFQVSRSTIRDAENRTQQAETEESEQDLRYSLADEKDYAYVHLRLVETSAAEAKRCLLWFKTMQVWQYHQLLEFPSILLPAFVPPLKALQKMSRMTDVPFQNLLTLRAGDEPPEIPPPLYSLRPGFSFDLSCLSNDGTKLSYATDEVPMPSDLSRHSTLDSTQSKAVLNSLGRSFALIQGPPGTGKSYTGEALIKVLLANKSKARLGPIMCVCYTNHALDQLLEHLLDDDVQNIIRIGSRSKSERLDAANLRQVAQVATRTSMEGRALYESIEDLNSDTAAISQELSTFKFLNANDKIRLFLAESNPSQHEQLFGPEPENEEGWQTVRRSRKKAVTKWLSGGVMAKEPRPLPELYHVRLPDLSHQERIVLYEDWVQKALSEEIEELSELHEGYENHKEHNNKVRHAIDLRCLQQANIIGVTTTGLATNLDLLRRVQVKVLLCEEAGEVLEGHLLTALLPTVEHAILIGDHLQLRPQIQDWRLQRANPAGTKYSLDMSLFERLVQPPANVPSLPFSILDTQRRMHPSISELVRSTLYPSLSDSEGVREYPEVCGLAKRLFWLHHESPESGRHSDQDSIETSYSNDFEIEMVSALVSHLLRQGVYKSGEIAVLTPYLGQLKKLQQKLGSMMQIIVNDRDMEDLAEMDSSDKIHQAASWRGAAKATALHGVRAATVDNFQGEEANVVIVSLVRSNNEKRCGFLSTPNRINVLLSRAKHGMYIIGNSSTSSHVPMWAQVIEILQNSGNIGRELELQCPRHPDGASFVSRAEHFIQSSPDGGCNLRCDRRLACGHSCTGPCHSDFLHNALKCLEDCVRPKEGCDHACRKRCGEPCDKLCREVLRGVKLVLSCGHIVDDVECWIAQDPSTIKCVVPVNKQVPGCTHTVKMPCHVDVTTDSYQCKSECGFQRSCGHTCKLQCSTCREREDGKVIREDHGTCKQLCERPFTACRHRCKEPCHGQAGCPPCSAPCQNQCVHSKCGKWCHEICAPCAKETCSSSCPHSKCSMPCAAPCDWIPCTKRCTKRLECGHQCPSICGERCPHPKYCQACAVEDVQDRTVDFIMMENYRSIDLDEDPCIFPDCGHFLTVTTMDGQMGLGDHYVMSPEGVPVALKTGSEPFSTTEVKVCPECRGSLRNISRYGRIVRRGLLDESTKKFITWSRGVWEGLMKAFLDAQDALQKMNRICFVSLSWRQRSFNLEGTRQDQVDFVLKTRTGTDRYPRLRLLRNQIMKFYEAVRRDEQPYQRVAHLVWHVNKRRKTSDFSFDESAIQMGGMLQAMSLLLRCDLLIISDYVGLCRSVEGNAAAKAAKIDVTPYIRDGEKLIHTAHMRNFNRLELEGHIFLVKFCSLANPDDTMPTKTTVGPDGQAPEREKVRDVGERHLQLARELIRQKPSTAPLEPELEAAGRMLHGGVFYNEVSTDEMRQVYEAMSTELRGTGHWYTCLNGHPFTIGECGMPMQLARCPECDAPVGGQSHQAVEGVRRAVEIEEIARGVDRMGL
ncbi:P-loop containing nucleoside triphosphate hydrolase protein [Colletotrichum zoysiae]|uniref:P-loop containing nucleoside triphosphate hydrolase protein n=1 Tax=Colletotrichum zoysiae TaxID=1216348 RepID=A0AAD9HPR6_9PEZI|nr:P-loop containing nucleoside triphosphate hydrolase protein [Colletotrichum zoysiae]